MESTILKRKNQPNDNQIVLGFNEIAKEWIRVQYRLDSNRFFEYPYTGAIYPILIMNIYQNLIKK